MWGLVVLIKIRILHLNSSTTTIDNENTKEDSTTNFKMDQPKHNRNQIDSYLQAKNSINNNNNNKMISGSFGVCMENKTNNSIKRNTNNNENCTNTTNYNNNPDPVNNNKSEEFCQLLEKFQSTVHSFITEFLESQIVDPSTPSTTIQSNVPKKYNLKIKIKLINHILSKFEPGVRKLLQEEVLSTMCHLSPCNLRRLYKARDGYDNSSSSNPSEVLWSYLEDNLKYLTNLINKLKCQQFEQSDLLDSDSSRAPYDEKPEESYAKLRPKSPRVIPHVHYQNVVNQIFEKPFEKNDPIYKHDVRPTQCGGEKHQSSFYLGPCKSCNSDTELRIGESIFTGLYNIPKDPDARKILECKIAQHLKSMKDCNQFRLRPATAAVSSYRKMRQHELSTFQSFEDALLSYARMSKCVPLLWCGEGPDGKPLLYPSSDCNFNGSSDFSWKNSCCGSFTGMNPSEVLKSQNPWGDYGNNNNMERSPRKKYRPKSSRGKYDGYSSSEKGRRRPRRNTKYPRQNANTTTDDEGGEDAYTGDDSDSDYPGKSKKKDKSRGKQKKKLKYADEEKNGSNYDDDDDNNDDDSRNQKKSKKNNSKQNNSKKPKSNSSKSKLSSRSSLSKVGAGLKYAKSRNGDADDNDDEEKSSTGRKDVKKIQAKGTGQPKQQNKGTGNESKRNKNQGTGTDSRTKVSGNQTQKIDRQSKGVGNENKTQGKGIQTKGAGNKATGIQTKWKKGEESSYDEDFDNGKNSRRTGKNQTTSTSPSRTQNNLKEQKKQKGDKSINTSNKPSRQNVRAQSTKGTSTEPNNNRPGTSSSKGTSMEPHGKKSRSAFYPPGKSKSTFTTPSGKSSRGNLNSSRGNNSRGTSTDPKKLGINRGTSPDQRHHGKRHGASRSTSTRNLQKHRSRGTSPDYKLVAEKNIAGKNQSTNTQSRTTQSSSTQPKSHHSRIGSIECSESDFENLKPSHSNKSSRRALTSRSRRLASYTNKSNHYSNKRNEASQSNNDNNNYNKNRTNRQQQQESRKFPPLYEKRSLSRGRGRGVPSPSSRKNFTRYTNESSTTVADNRLPFVRRKNQGQEQLEKQQRFKQYRNVGSGDMTMYNKGSKSKHSNNNNNNNNNSSSSRIISNRHNQGLQSSRRGRSLARNYIGLPTVRRKSTYRNLSSKYNIRNNNSKYYKMGKSETHIASNIRQEPYNQNKLPQTRLNTTYSSTVRSFVHSFANMDKKRASIFEDEPQEIPIDLTCPQETFFWVPLGRYSWEMKRIKVCKTIKDPREDLGSKQYMYMYPNTKIKTNPLDLCSSPCCVSDAENDHISHFCDTVTCKNAESSCSCLFECPSQLL